MKYRLKSKNFNNEDSDLALYELLEDRGIDSPAEWLYPKDEFENFALRMENMNKAINILYTTITHNREANILVVVDSDLDGYTSGAIILTLLHQISKDQEVDYVLHPGKEHGIDLKDVPESTDLIIVPDAGSSQKEEHLKLLANGTKIIILDHHEISNDMAYGKYENDIALVSSQLDYDNPALSGAGVALKFVQAYCFQYGIQFPMKLYALAACGIIADVMDIRNLENKYIVETGLKYINEYPFLMELIKKAHFNMENPIPTIKDIGWVIGPNINSIIRLGTTNQKHIIFRALVTPMAMTLSSKLGSEDEEVPIYEEAARLCANAKKRQTTAINRSIKIINNELEDNGHNSIVYIDNDQDLTFELSGLIANKLLSDYNKPVILLRHFVDKDVDQYRGSVRGKAVEGLENLRDVVHDLTGVEMAEGHAFAFGINIDSDSIDEFKVHLNSILDKLDFNSNFYLVEFISRYNEVNKEIGEIFGRDDIWAHGVEKPLAVITDIPTTKYEIMGYDDQHIKIDCGNYDVVFFNVPELVNKIKTTPYNINVVGEFDIDKSYNVGRLQFIVKDYELAAYTAPTIWDVQF